MTSLFCCAMNFSNKGIGTLGDHPFITSAIILGGWVRKMAIFANVQYFMYADIVGGWVGKSPKICWRNIGMVQRLNSQLQYPKLSLIVNVNSPSTSWVESMTKHSGQWVVKKKLRLHRSGGGMQWVGRANLNRFSPVYHVPDEVFSMRRAWIVPDPPTLPPLQAKITFIFEPPTFFFLKADSCP